MEYYGEYTPPFLSSSLERILKIYEDSDCILFEPVTLPKATNANSTNSTNINNNSSNFQSRKSDRKIPVPTAKLHSNPQKPLPALAEDEDTRFLRSQVSELEHQSLDLTVQIQLMQQKIDELEKQIADITTQNIPTYNFPAATATTISAQKKARKICKSPAISRGHQITPRGMTPKSLAAYYRDKFEKVKQQYEGLTMVLSQHGQYPKTSATGLPHTQKH